LVWTSGFHRPKLQRCDNKTVRIGNKAGVSVPNALEKVDGWKHLMEIADRHGLGHDLVVQSAFGIQIHTTFSLPMKMISSKHKDEIVQRLSQDHGKRINCQGCHGTGCATKCGTDWVRCFNRGGQGQELTPTRVGWWATRSSLARSRKCPTQGAGHGGGLWQPAA
jgi:hypothetical protein